MLGGGAGEGAGRDARARPPRHSMRAEIDTLKRKHKDAIVQLEAKITASAAKVSDAGDASAARLRHKLKDVKRKGREYVEQMTALHKTEMQKLQAKFSEC